MIESPEIAETAPQTAAVIRITVPREQMQSVMEPAIGEFSTSTWAYRSMGLCPRPAT